MASLEFDIGLYDSPTPPETSISRTLTSAVSSLISAVKPNFSDEDSTDQTASNPINNDVRAFDILRNFLQPDTTLSLEYVIKALLNILPPDNPRGPAVYSLCCVCVDMAEQIPYHHPSHQKMARVLEHLRKSTKVNREIIIGLIWTTLTYSHDGEPISIRDAYVLGAAQWILWCGQSLFMQIRYPGDVLPETTVWTPGKPPSSIRKPLLTLHKWQFWRDCFRAAAGEESEAGDECKAVSTKAADMMDAIEKNMSF